MEPLLEKSLTEEPDELSGIPKLIVPDKWSLIPDYLLKGLTGRERDIITVMHKMAQQNEYLLQQVTIQNGQLRAIYSQQRRSKWLVKLVYFLLLVASYAIPELIRKVFK